MPRKKIRWNKVARKKSLNKREQKKKAETHFAKEKEMEQKSSRLIKEYTNMLIIKKVIKNI